MKIKICKICASVSLAWILLTIAIWQKILVSPNWITFTALLMGGSVVGIAYQKKSFFWKAVVIICGMPLAFIFVTNISAPIIIVEITILAFFAFYLFVKKDNGEGENKTTAMLEKEMKNCC